MRSALGTHALSWCGRGGGETAAAIATEHRIWGQVHCTVWARHIFACERRHNIARSSPSQKCQGRTNYKQAARFATTHVASFNRLRVYMPAFFSHLRRIGILLREAVRIVYKVYSVVLQSHCVAPNSSPKVPSENPMPVARRSQLLLVLKPKNCVTASARKTPMNETEIAQ